MDPLLGVEAALLGARLIALDLVRPRDQRRLRSRSRRRRSSGTTMAIGDRALGDSVDIGGDARRCAARRD